MTKLGIEISVPGFQSSLAFNHMYVPPPVTVAGAANVTRYAGFPLGLLLGPLWRAVVCGYQPMMWRHTATLIRPMTPRANAATAQICKFPLGYELRYSPKIRSIFGNV